MTGAHHPHVIALDLSLTCVGYASTRLGSGTFRPEGRGMRRLNGILEEIRHLIPGHHLVLVEGYSYASKGRAVVSIGELGGVVRLYLWKSGIPYVEIPPSSMKKVATGKGNAPKELVLVEAVRRLGYGGASNHVADALWLLQAAQQHYDLPGKVDLPKAHLSGLAKIEWQEVA